QLRRRPPNRRAGRVQPDEQGVLEPRRRAHRAVRDREVRLMSELRAGFHQQLEHVRTEVARLGASVVELIPRATDILLQQDLEGAEYVLQGDAEIDARALEIEETALQLLALQAPVAGDLRHLAAALKLAPEIERSADLCCNI